jgi:hypothetical protein
MNVMSAVETVLLMDTVAVTVKKDDCAGVCGGTKVVDECGVCGGPGIRWDLGKCNCE